MIFVNTNEELESEISELIKQDEYTGASDKLLKLNTIKGKLTQKVSTLTKSINSSQRIQFTLPVHKTFKRPLE